MGPPRGSPRGAQTQPDSQAPRLSTACTSSSSSSSFSFLNRACAAGLRAPGPSSAPVTGQRCRHSRLTSPARRERNMGQRGGDLGDGDRDGCHLPGCEGSPAHRPHRGVVKLPVPVCPPMSLSLPPVSVPAREDTALLPKGRVSPGSPRDVTPQTTPIKDSPPVPPAPSTHLSPSPPRCGAGRGVPGGGGVTHGGWRS